MRYSIRSLKFRDGTVEDIPDSGIVVIVGANNAGKSALLNEINQLVTHDPDVSNFKWLSGVDTERDTSEESFDAWFGSIARTMPEVGPHAGRFGIWDPNSGPSFIAFEEAKSAWTQGWSLGILAQRFVAHLDAMSRSALLQAAPPRDQQASALHPIHKIWDSHDLEDRLSKMIKRAFGFEISINRYSLSPQMLVGKPSLEDVPPPANDELLAQYTALRPVMSEGDGIKSFIGLLLSCIASDVRINLIDEPEAFLRPPQARLLGKYLVEETRMDGQVVLATHSTEILEGVLAGNSTRPVKIIRLAVRDQLGVRSRNVLAPERVQNLWTDPLLRYSRMLSGLFHKGVIICESDGDCRFYESALDAHLGKQVEHDLLFTYVGGKARLPHALRELNAFELRTAAIGDIDLLDDESYMKQIVESVGAEWANFEADVKLVQKQMNERAASPTVGSLKAELKEISKRPDASRITDDDAKKVAKSVKFKRGWEEAKRAGVAAFENDAAAAISRILDGLYEFGLFLVPVGELERWFKDVEAKHGIPYVTKVLEDRRYESPTVELSAFLRKLSKYFEIELNSSPMND